VSQANRCSAQYVDSLEDDVRAVNTGCVLRDRASEARLEDAQEELQTALKLLQLTPSGAKSFEYGDFLRDHEPILLQLSYLQRSLLVLIPPGPLLIVLACSLIGYSTGSSRLPVELTSPGEINS
jgi:hypothetical protein